MIVGYVATLKGGPSEETVQRLGEKFYELLVKDIGEKNIAKVRKRNATSKHAGCCASHDFCDANMVMAEALAQCDIVKRDKKGEPDFDINDDRLMLLWGKAWSHAKVKYLGGHDCYQHAKPYGDSGGPLGHGWVCGKCGLLLQVG